MQFQQTRQAHNPLLNNPELPPVQGNNLKQRDDSQTHNGGKRRTNNQISNNMLASTPRQQDQVRNSGTQRISSDNRNKRKLMPIQAINQAAAAAGSSNQGHIIIPQNAVTFNGHANNARGQAMSIEQPVRRMNNNNNDMQSPNTYQRQDRITGEGKRKQVRVDREEKVFKDLPRQRNQIFAFLEGYKQLQTKNGQNGHAAALIGSTESQPSTSAESANRQGLKHPSPLVSYEEGKYLEYYGLELFTDMQSQEHKCQFESLLHNQEEITRQLRASVIDWLFEVGSKLGIQDKSVIFQAISLMDRFYNAQTQSLQAKDLQLTAVTSLFIASKNVEVDPLDLETCQKTLCFNKYSRNSFLRKEADIRKATVYENESPTILDFIMFFLRCLNFQFGSTVDNLVPQASGFLREVQTIAYDLCKSVIIDASLLKYKPSVLAATLIFQSIQLEFETLQKNRVLKALNEASRDELDFVHQVCLAYRAWRYQVLDQMLHVQEIDKILNFSDHVFNRQLSLYNEYKDQFPNLYRERVADFYTVPSPLPCSTQKFGSERSQNQSPMTAPGEDVEMADETGAAATH